MSSPVRASRRRRLRRLAAVVLGLAAFVAVSGFAATLGGVFSADLGSSASTVTSCNTDGVDLDFSYGFAAGEYVVTGATVTDIDPACHDQIVQVHLVTSLGPEDIMIGFFDSVGGTNDEAALPFFNQIPVSALEYAYVVILEEISPLLFTP